MTKKKDIEKDLPSEISRQSGISAKAEILRGEPSEIPQSGESEADISQGEEMIASKELEYLDGWKRCQADFENYKKRQLESQKDFVRFAAENIIHQILPVLDNFRASTDHIPEDQKNNPWVTGIMHIQKQLENVLKDNGVEEIKVEIGDEFDPNLHEAVKADANLRTESESTNKIMKILSKGYKLGDKIIRAARVTVN